MSPSLKSEARWILVLRSSAVCSALLLLLILAFLCKESWPVLREKGLSAFIYPGAWSPREGEYSLLAMLMGTLSVTAGALLIATPLGLLTALCCNYYMPPRLASYLKRMLEILSGIPSVVYGFWGLTEIVPLVNRIHPPGASLLTGSIVLAIMVLPTLALMADASIVSVPTQAVKGAAALGLDTWGVFRSAVWPAARPGLMGAVLLATGRALGETMAVIMICGNIVQVPTSIFDPVRTLTANIALEMAYAMNFHRSALFVSGLLLAFCIAIIVSLASLVRPRHA